MIVPMIIVVMPMIMRVTVMVVMSMPSVQAASARAERVAQAAIGHIGSGSGGALSLDMVVMRFLNGADLCFEAQDLDPVLAQHAGRRWNL